jgi:hypothetical protein
MHVCGVARAVGVIDCPECGTIRAPFRENGEGVVFDFVDASSVQESDRSGTQDLSERTEE